MFEADLTAFVGFERSLTDALDAVIEAAVERAAEVIAYAAKADHPYTDRTGRLTASIEALPATRTSDGARGGVLAGMDYASFVERGTSRNRPYPYLQPAATRSEARIEHELDRILSDAVGRLR